MQTDQTNSFSVKQVLAKKIPQDQLQAFVFLLIEGLLDAQSHCSSGTCVVMNTMFKTRGSEMMGYVSYFAEVLWMINSLLWTPSLLLPPPLPFSPSPSTFHSAYPFPPPPFPTPFPFPMLRTSIYD